MKTIKQARAERMLTARQLAERAGLSHATVYMVENGKTIPRLEAVRKLSAALEVDPMEVSELRHAIEVAAGAPRTKEDQELERAA